MKIILNIFIIILVGLLSSTYLFDFSPIDYRDSIEIENDKDTSNISLVIEGTAKLSNPESIAIYHVCEKDESVISVSENIFSANIYKDNKLIFENIKDLELVSILTQNSSLTINKDNPLLTTIDISQNKLGLTDGKYKIVLESNLISNSNDRTISINVTYDTKGFYIPAISTAPLNTKGLTLYFTNQNSDMLIPVTRFVVEDKSITRMAIEQLQNGPVDTSMKTVIGNVSNCTYNNGNVLIDIPSTYEQYNQNSNSTKLIYEAFVKTIFDVKRYWPIHSVSFSIDRKTKDTYFNGIDVKKPVLNVENNYIYHMAYKINDRYYLIEEPANINDINLNKDDMLEIKIQKFYDSYLKLELDNYKNPISKDIILQNVTIDKNILQVDFNDNFLKSYANKDDLKLMMIDSLVYTFTSVPTIDGIKITINDKPLTNFVKDRDLSGILTKPKFINPEKFE